MQHLLWRSKADQITASLTPKPARLSHSLCQCCTSRQLCPLGTHRGILAALSRTASLRLLSLVNCGVGGGAAFGARFAAHPYLRVRTRSECQDALSTDAISLGGWLAA